MSEYVYEADAVNPCRGCGADAGPDVPQPLHCHLCPPWTCEACGETCHFTAPCPCWVSLDGLHSFADIKAVFAEADLSIDPRAES